MICLGIETSCDETSLALVEDGRLLAQTLATQADLHAIFAGVVPELASREHYRHIGPLFDQLLASAALPAKNIDCIAVGRGPGLLGSLLVGAAFAKALALALGIPVIGVNHLHAHLLGAGLSQSLVYPALGLVVSGGHTHLYRIDGPDRFIQLGRSLDDAAGEVFDKVGNEMGLSYPAGKSVDEKGATGNADAFLLPRPYLQNNNLDFSFSGLKTAALCAIDQAKNNNVWDSQSEKDLCASLNAAIAETLRAKTARALSMQEGIKAIWLAGGVAANSCLRMVIQELAMEKNIKFIAPESRYCTDNGGMIAYAGWLLRSLGYRHGLNFEIIPRGRRVPDDMTTDN